jgi:reverse gyrase
MVRIKQSELPKIIEKLDVAIKIIGNRTKACLMIISSEPNKDRVVDRYLSKKSKELIRQADVLEGKDAG